jgi:hypothetical protein
MKISSLCKTASAVSALCAAVVLAASPAGAQTPTACEAPNGGIGLVAIDAPANVPAGSKVTITVEVCSTERVKQGLLWAYLFQNQNGVPVAEQILNKDFSLNAAAKQFRVHLVVPAGTTEIDFSADATDDSIDPYYGHMGAVVLIQGT